jgi:hypothetical protein
MLGPKFDVFLSYSRQDSDRVRPLRDALQRLGYRVFFDVQSIEPGERWKTRLEKSIRASRTLVLCWSEHTRSSDYITFEYSRAEALRKPVIPWKLDATPLPAMLEVQGITTADADAAAAALRPVLGPTLGLRRALFAATATCVVALLAFGLWLALRPGPPPPPWDFEGDVTDRVTSMPIPGVEVDILAGNTIQASAATDNKGHYDIRMPQPRPATINVRYRKSGYAAEAPLNIPTGKYWNMDMTPLH